MNAEAIVSDVVERLKGVPGVVGIVLGGSRAKGTHTPESDIDIGIYYESEETFDLESVRRAAAELDDEHREDAVTALGEWGPWINGGGWLTVRGHPVDWLFRDAGKVARVTGECAAGDVTIDYYPGHPHGFTNAIYMAEIALCKPLWDPRGFVAALKAKATPYPAPLRRAIVAKFLWEASFSLNFAGKSVRRKDAYHAAGCLFRAASCLNQTLFALNETHWMNETGALGIADGFARKPERYMARANDVFAILSAEPERIEEAIERMRELVRETEALAAAVSL